MSKAFFDLHVHSDHSFDSYSSPSDIVEEAIRKGLRGIAIADHGTIQGGLEALEYASKRHPSFIVIVGSEINTVQGEIMGLFLKRNIETRDPLEVIDEIKKQGGISVLPHPLKRGDISNQNELLKKIDAIEVFNARTYIKLNLEAAKIARSLSKSTVGGSDAHYLSEIGLGITLLDDSFENKKELKMTILKGRNNVRGITSSPFAEVNSQWIRFFKLKKFDIAKRNFFRAQRLFYLVPYLMFKGDYSAYYGRIDYTKITKDQN